MKRIFIIFSILAVLIVAYTGCEVAPSDNINNNADLNSDAILSALTISSGILDPVFDPNTLSYDASVDNVVASITVKPIANDPAYAGITVDGTDMSSDNSSDAISLTPAVKKQITIVVTAEDGTTQKTYTINITRKPASYVVSGAGLGPINATYVYTGMNNGKPYYRIGSNNVYYDGDQWRISNNLNARTVTSYYFYYNDADGYYPPTSGWANDTDGTGSAPTLTAQ